jgi:cell wall-associated NlpC family hydrolase
VLNGRRRVSAAITAVLLAVAIGSVPSSPAQAEPTIDEVQTRVDDLYHQAEQASERYNDAKVELEELRKDLNSLQADQDRQDARLTTVREQVQDSIVSQYQGTTLSAVGQAVVSEDPARFLSQLTTIAAYNDIQSQLFADYTTELKALDIRRAATASRRDQMAALGKRLAKEKETIDAKAAEAEEQLGQLKEEEREELLASRSGDVRLPSDVPASGRSAAAVQYALAQVGDSYVWGAAGPSAFDCSGLTMMAWAQAGVGLPHSSRMQFESGAPVSSSALQPGDLVFYYSPISHVAIYIGNGLIVDAANPGAGVRVAGVFSMPYSGAVRPG